MPSPESEDETRPAKEAAEAERGKSDEPAWPPAEARPEETGAPSAEGPAAATTPDAPPPEGGPVLTTPEEPSAAKAIAPEQTSAAEPEGAVEQLATAEQPPAAEPQQEMGFSESTLHWLVDGEQPIAPVANDPGTAPHYDPRAPVAGRKRTVVVVGGAAILAFVVAVVLHGQAARNRAAAIAPAVVRPEPAAVLTQRAEAALARGRSGEAFDLANLALGSDARSADALIVIGKVLRDGGRLAESRDAYRKYLELAPLGTHAEEARAALATLPL